MFDMAVELGRSSSKLSESLRKRKPIRLDNFVLTKYNSTCREENKMDFMTIKEAAQKWELTERMVQYHCKAGRIPGVVKLSGVWLIPKEAKRPDDKRMGRKGATT